MSSFIDLHTHSNASDGVETPSRVFELAVAAGLSAVALTDHDTVSGVEEFLAAGKESVGTEAIAGIELSSLYASAREIHIVGLFIDPTAPGLLDFIALQRESRRRRNEAIRIKLTALGFPLTWDEPEFSLGIDGVGRPHFARALIRKYGFPDIRSVFDKLLGHSRPAFVPRRLPDAGAAIAAIHAAGGVAVWAHPTYRERNERAFLRRAARHLSGRGLDAMEGYYSLFGPGETALVTEIATAAGLAISGGSDFHGGDPGFQVGTGAGGLRVPAELLPELRRRHQLISARTSPV